jgi:hypothetical protein
MQPEIAILLYMLAIVELSLLYIVLVVPRPRNPLRRERPPPPWPESIFAASIASSLAASAAAPSEQSTATAKSSEEEEAAAPRRRRTRFRRWSLPSPEGGLLQPPKGSI